MAIVGPTIARGQRYCGLRTCEPNSDLALALAASTALVPLIAAVLYTYWATRRYATTLRSGRPAA